MSLEPSGNVIIQPTVYQHLRRLYTSNDPAAQKKNFDALPKHFRKQIFDSVLKQTKMPVEAISREFSVFDSKDKLQEAIKEVVTDVFNSLPPTEQAKINREMSDHYKSDSSQDWIYGKKHLTDPISPLLKTMHSLLADLTPELQKILDEWVKQGESGEQRTEAKARIIDFLKDPRKTELSLDRLRLKSLPDIFGEQPFISRLESLDLSYNQLRSLNGKIGRLENLTSLNLSYNQLRSLNGKIGRLENLTSLNLSDNQLRSLTGKIGRLQHLRSLNLSYNHLTDLPRQISKLQHLSHLFLSNNGLTSIPEEIDLPQNLAGLHLSYNQLTWIPNQINQLQNLIALHISNNSLQSIPNQINQLRNLIVLNLEDNPTLENLPTTLLNLPHICRVYIERTGLSQNFLASLQQICNATDYLGPRIFFSIGHVGNRHVEQHNDEVLKPLPQLIEELFSVLREDSKAFPELYQLDVESTNSIQAWLSRLSYTADYQRRGECQKTLIKQIVDYLQQANDDPQFREIFLETIEEAARTCGDRIALSILHVGIALRLHQIKDIRELKNFLIGTVWPVQMLEEIAREKVETLPFVDEIEVYLGYPIMLRETLKLEITPQKMLYFGFSHLKPEDLALAAKRIFRQKADKHAMCTFLSNQEAWTKALQAQYPEYYEEIDREKYQELEDAGEDWKQINQVRANQEKRLVDLTTWALDEMDSQLRTHLTTFLNMLSSYFLTPRRIEDL